MHFITCFSESFLASQRRFLSPEPLQEGAALEQRHSRCFGYYETRPEAVQAVLANRGDIHEYLYTLCVVEELGPGIHPLGETEENQWFRYDPVSRCWSKIDTPEEVKHLVNFSIG